MKDPRFMIDLIHRTLMSQTLSAPMILATILIIAIACGANMAGLTFAQAQVDDGNNNTSGGLDDEPMAMDIVPPLVKITTPSSCSNSIMSPGIVLVQGVASDDSSGVKKVEAFSHTYPFNDEFPFEMATPAAQAKWDSWSILVKIHDTRTRILVRATDNAGNENWDDIVIDIEEVKAKISSRDSGNSVAFVEPSFTNAAYNVGGFYEFYAKYNHVTPGHNVTDDLELMTADIPTDPERAHFEPLVQKVREFRAQDSDVTIIGDMNVHDGFIFRADGSNAYQALFLLHNEYVTQEEYDNIKRFVSNGGKAVFIDSNIFYAEVTYDPEYCTVTLIKGHDWEFDGKAARRSVSERYFDENREWVGSNYMINALWDPVYFANNPFNYTHFEENYVTNPNATIFHDYGLTIGDNYESDEFHRNQTIAAYELNYGEGKSIMLGIYGQNEADDPIFLDFFETVILMHALANEYRFTAGDQEYSVLWRMESGSVSQVIADSESRKLTVTVDRTDNTADVLRISLPKKLIDIGNSSNGPNDYYSPESGQGEISESSSNAESGSSRGSPIQELIIRDIDGKVDGSEGYVRAAQEANDYERVIDIPLSPDTTTIEIYGTHVAPEFGLSGLMFLLSAGTIGSSIVVLMIFHGRIVKVS